MKETITDKENQHYIPKFYLRYFSYQNNKKQIGMYNLKSHKYISQAKLKTQASKKYFYGKDGIIEDWLASIESVVAPTFNRMFSNEILPKRESNLHVDFLFFILLLDLRNPAKIKEWSRGLELIRDRLVSKNKNSEVVRPIEEFSSPEVAIRMMVSKSEELIPYCMDLEYKLIKNTSNTPFVTSDNPLIKYNQFLEKRKWDLGGHTGYAIVGLKIILPLNENYMLILFDPTVYKLGNKKEKIVEISETNSIDQLNLLQFLNCSEVVYCNHRVSEIYLNQLAEKAEKRQKANETFAEFYKVDDGKGGVKESEEVIAIGSTDLKINLNIQKLNFHSKAVAVKLDNRAAQLRPKVKEIVRFKQIQKEYRRRKNY